MQGVKLYRSVLGELVDSCFLPSISCRMADQFLFSVYFSRSQFQMCNVSVTYSISQKEKSLPSETIKGSAVVALVLAGYLAFPCSVGQKC